MKMNLKWLGWEGRRGRSTLLWVTSERLVRADFKGGRPLVLEGIWESASPSGASLGELARAAWLLGPRGRRRAHLLTEQVVTQSLSIPSGKVVGLEGAGLGRALAFEAEAVSGIGPFDAVQGWVGCEAREGLNWYWVSQLPRAELERVSAMLGAAGAELAGALHPCGSPARQGPGTGGWQRIELWEDRVVCVDGLAHQSPWVRVLEMPPSRPGWRELASGWFQAFKGERTILAATGALARHGPGLARVLEDEGELRGWLAGWAAVLGSDFSRVPVVRPVRSAGTARGRVMRGPMALAAGVLLACGMHWTWMRARAAGLIRELAEASRPAAEWAEQRKRADGLEVELAAARLELKGMQELRVQWKDTLDREHRRHATLLRALGELMPEGALLAGLEEGHGEMRISTVSVSPEASGLGVRMEQCMEPFGWRVEPPSRRGLGMLAGGGPWQVEWTLRILAPPPGEPTSGPTNVAAGLSIEAARASVMAVGIRGGDAGRVPEGGTRNGGGR